MDARPSLTRRQANVLQFIRDYAANHEISPTLDEIGTALGVNRVTIFEHVRALETKGWIRTSPHLSRSIRVIDAKADLGIPILGRIAAGRPIEAVEDRETFDLESFFPSDRDCFILRVQGDSMIDDQIRDGDYVLVESRPTAQPGETVVALLGEQEATLKRFYPMGRQVRLEPRNPLLKPIVVDARKLRIQGVVIGVLRRY